MYHVTGTVTDNLSGFNPMGAIGVTVNGYQGHGSFTDATVQDYINGNKDVTDRKTTYDFDMSLEKYGSVIENGVNEITVGIDDAAFNYGETTINKDVTVDPYGNKSLLLYNVTDRQILTEESPYYNADDKTITIYGYYPRDFYLNDKKVEVNEDGTFEAKVDASAEIDSLVFSLDTLDNKNARIIKDMKVGFATTPEIKINKEGAELYGSGEDGLYVFKNKDDFFEISGTVTGGPLDIIQGVIVPASDNMRAKLVQDSNGGTLSFGLNYDEATKTFDQRLKLGNDGVAGFDFEGDNTITISGGNSIDNYGGVAAKSDQILVRQLQRTYLNWDNISDGGMVTYIGDDAEENGYDAEKGVFVVTGDVLDVHDFRILLNPTHPEAEENQVKVNEDGSFAFEIPMKATQSKNLGYEFVTDDTDEFCQGGFSVALDTVFPHIDIPDSEKWAVSEIEDVDYEVWTNSDTFTLSGTVGDDLTGYSLFLGDDEEFKYNSNSSLITDKDRYLPKDHEFSKTFDLYKTDDEKDIVPNNKANDNMFSISVEDIEGNVVQKLILVHQSSEAPQAPEVTANTAELTNKPVLLAAKQADNVPVYYTLDGGKTWEPYAKEITKGVNGEVAFKAVDKFGNESDVVNYHVTNVVTEIAAQPTADLSDFDLEKNGVTVTLNFDKKLTEEQKAYVHLRYSVDGGKTWKEYTEPFAVTSTMDVLVQSYDDAGNESAEKTVTVNVKAPEKDNEDPAEVVDKDKNKDVKNEDDPIVVGTDPEKEIEAGTTDPTTPTNPTTTPDDQNGDGEETGKDDDKGSDNSSNEGSDTTPKKDPDTSGDQNTVTTPKKDDDSSDKDGTKDPAKKDPDTSSNKGLDNSSNKGSDNSSNKNSDTTGKTGVTTGKDAATDNKSGKTSQTSDKNTGSKNNSVAAGDVTGLFGKAADADDDTVAAGDVSGLFGKSSDAASDSDSSNVPGKYSSNLPNTGETKTPFAMLSGLMIIFVGSMMVLGLNFKGRKKNEK